MVEMSIEEYERQEALIEWYSKLSEVEAEIENGANGEDFLKVAQNMRLKICDKI